MSTKLIFQDPQWSASGMVPAICVNLWLEQYSSSKIFLLNVCLFQVKIIAMNENVILRSALDKNLKSAVTAAFLMLPESFSEEDLFIEIAGLSYSG